MKEADDPEERKRYDLYIVSENLEGEGGHLNQSFTTSEGEEQLRVVMVRSPDQKDRVKGETKVNFKDQPDIEKVEEEGDDNTHYTALSRATTAIVSTGGHNIVV